MTVPGISAVRPGVDVQIVLKADQRSGKLTQGKVQDILTRGDHPRGIKVRLQNGQIGRVQSLGTTSFSAAASPMRTQSVMAPSNPVPTIAPRRVVHIQDDYRNDPVPDEERSLEDYVTIKPAKVKRKGAAKKIATATEDQQEPPSVQEQLQRDFPQLDSALIAAILSDSDSADAARKILAGLS